MTPPNKKSQEPLHRRALANTLIQQMLKVEQGSDAFMQKVTLDTATDAPKQVPLHAALKELTNLIWLARAGKATEQENTRRLALMDDFSRAPANVQYAVADFMAHAGQLHQMAGLLARESMLLLSKDKDKLHPVRRMLFGDPNLPHTRNYATAQEAVTAIGKPAFEMTFTGHPTNTNSVASMRTQRELAAALMALSKNTGKETLAAAAKAMKTFAEAPLLPMKNGVPTPLTVPEETKTMLYFLGNMYDDLPATYASFDSEMTRAYDGDYRPQDLKLGLKFHSWGSSGDKDGNANVNADTTLTAIAEHKAEIFKRYYNELKALDLPQLKEITANIEVAAASATHLGSMLETMLVGSNRLTAEQFDVISENLKYVSEQVKMPEIIKTVEDAYESASEDKKPQLLNLLRRMRTFGSNFGQIEYRETAEEYERVIAELVPEYAALYAPVRAATEALNPQKKKLADLEKAKDKEGIEVQKKVVERYQAALDRCKDEFAAQQDARTKILNHLFSDPEALKEVTARVGALNSAASMAYNNVDARPIAYQTLKRMELARDFPDAIQNNVLAECKGTSNMLEALLLQHVVAKDGRRAVMGIVPLFEEHETLKHAPDIVRSALENPIYRAHLTAVSKQQFTPEAQQIQLAHSDNAKRAGVPAAGALVSKAHEELRAMMQQFNAHTKNKVGIQFFEGGSQSDIYRGGGRAISAAVNLYGLHDFAKMTFQGGDLLNFFNIPAASTRLLTHNLANCIKGPAKSEQAMSRTDHQVIAAFDSTKISYIEKMFEDPRYVDFLNKINYSAVTEAGNYSSRAAGRSGSKKVENVNGTRAIGISETLQHAGLSGTWIGVRNIEAALAEKIEGASNPIIRKRLYKESPTYRKIIDNMLAGLMRTDLNYVSKLSADKNGKEDFMMQELRDQYGEAMRFCIESYTGQPITRFVKSDMNDPVTLHNLIKDGFLRNVVKEQVYPHVIDLLADQEHFEELARHMETWKPQVKETSPQALTNNSLIHNMLDTIHHGRVPLIDDPTYAHAYCKERNIKREWVDENGRGV